jgi:hypothetical protein
MRDVAHLSGDAAQVGNAICAGSALGADSAGLAAFTAWPKIRKIA